MKISTQNRMKYELWTSKRENPIRLCLILGLLGLPVISAGQEELTSADAPQVSRAERLIIARCAVCHSQDLIIQQRLPQSRWEATVEKMKHWGADISQEEADLLVHYLSARYHPDAPDYVSPIDSELPQPEPLKQEPDLWGSLIGNTVRGAGIFARNCQTCHGAGGSGGMGPKLEKNPMLKHKDLFWETVSRGRGPMPAWGSFLSQQDIADVHAWLMDQ